MNLEECEWCSAVARWKIVASEEYRRFSCDEHLGKTKRTVFLDGHNVATTVFNSGGFEVSDE